MPAHTRIRKIYSRVQTCAWDFPGKIDMRELAEKIWKPKFVPRGKYKTASFSSAVGDDRRGNLFFEEG